MEDVSKQVDDGLVEPVEELCEEVETVRGFCYLWDRVNASGGCKACSCDSKSKKWVGEVQGMRGVAEFKKFLA